MSETQTPRTGSLADLKDLAVSAGVAVTPDDAPRYEAKRDALGRSYATGRRKNAIARVWIKPGKGEISVNGKKVGTYFARPVLRMLITQPFLWRIATTSSTCIAPSPAAACPARPGPCATASAGH